MADAARDLGIYDSTLGNWLKQARIDRGEQEGLSTEQRARLRELDLSVVIRLVPEVPASDRVE